MRPLFHLEILPELKKRDLLLDVRMSGDLVGAIVSMRCLEIVDKLSLHQ